MHREGLLGICVPKARRRPRRQLPHLLPRRRRARPLLRRHGAVLEHACLLDAVDRRAGRRPRDDDRRARRAQRAPRACTTSASSATAPSTRSPSPKAARPPPARSPSAPRRSPSMAASSSAARRSSPRCRAPPTTTACSAPSAARAREPRRRNTLYLAIPADAEGVSVVGDWDPLGMRGTVSRTLLFKDVFVPEDEMLMPRGVYFRAATSLAAHVPHAVADLHGARAGGLRFHRAPTCAASCPARRRSSGACTRPSRSPSPRCA